MHHDNHRTTGETEPSTVPPSVIARPKAVAIRIFPAPPGPGGAMRRRGGRIATALPGLAMTVVIDGWSRFFRVRWLSRIVPRSADGLFAFEILFRVVNIDKKYRYNSLETVDKQQNLLYTMSMNPYRSMSPYTQGGKIHYAGSILLPQDG